MFLVYIYCSNSLYPPEGCHIYSCCKLQCAETTDGAFLRDRNLPWLWRCEDRLKRWRWGRQHSDTAVLTKRGAPPAVSVAYRLSEKWGRAVWVGLKSLAKAHATRRHQVWHETYRQAYGVILTQSGNNCTLGIAGWQQSVGWCEQSASMCVCLPMCIEDKEGSQN